MSNYFIASWHFSSDSVSCSSDTEDEDQRLLICSGNTSELDI